MPETLFPPTSGAVLSSCAQYRYSLTRTWEPRLPRIFWCCLNPSTADAERDDPSLRKMCGFSRRWGFGGLILVNAFAVRATNPRDMLAHADPVGPDCDRAILDAAAQCARWIVAWGVNGAYRGRCREVLVLLAGRPIECLGRTELGQPKHPLYLAGATELRPFAAGGGE